MVADWGMVGGPALRSVCVGGLVEICKIMVVLFDADPMR